MKTYYLVYKLTNLVNDKIYIGCHQTKDPNDSYMGSGSYLNNAKKKYGIENFKKEILSFHESSEDMRAEEARLVDKIFLDRPDVYNLNLGGSGGWYYVNSTNRHRYYRKGNPNVMGSLKKALAASLIKWRDPVLNKSFRDKISRTLKERFKSGQLISVWIGRNHSDSTKEKIGTANAVKQKGNRNSQFGTVWIYNEKEQLNKKVKLVDLEIWITDGWERGRKPFPGQKVSQYK